MEFGVWGVKANARVYKSMGALLRAEIRAS